MLVHPCLRLNLLDNLKKKNITHMCVTLYICQWHVWHLISDFNKKYSGAVQYLELFFLNIGGNINSNFQPRCITVSLSWTFPVAVHLYT